MPRDILTLSSFSNDVGRSVAADADADADVSSTTLASVFLFDSGLDGRAEIDNYNKFMDEIFARFFLQKNYLFLWLDASCINLFCIFLSWIESFVVWLSHKFLHSKDTSVITWVSGLINHYLLVPFELRNWFDLHRANPLNTNQIAWAYKWYNLLNVVGTSKFDIIL